MKVAHVLRGGLVAALCLLSVGCAEDPVVMSHDMGREPVPSNPDAELREHTLLLYPGACRSVEIDNVLSFDDLRARGDDIASVELRRIVDLLGTLHTLRVCGSSVGTARVHLLDAFESVDSIQVEVAPLDSLALSAAQNILAQPRVPGPVGLLVNRGAMLYVSPVTADGRLFDVPYADYDYVEAPANVSVTNDFGGIYQLESARPGTFAIRLVGDPAGRQVDLVVVPPEAVVGLEISSLVRSSGSVSYSVVGLTSGGLRILGLDATLSVDGVVLEPSAGARWLFNSYAENAVSATVRATWGGLETIL